MKIEVIPRESIGDFVELIRVFEKVFGMRDFVLPDTAHLAGLLRQENFAAVVARVNDRVIGGLTTYVLDQYYSTRPIAYIFDLAVLEEYQRKGIGGKLIAFITDHYRQKGFEEVFVQADKVDDYAIDFYRKTRPTNEEDVIHFYYSLGKTE